MSASTQYFLVDAVIADRGLHVKMFLAEVKIYEGKVTIRKKGIDWSRELSVVRMHVE